MPLPAGLDKVTVTGRYECPRGTPKSGTIEFIGPNWISDTINNRVYTGQTTVTLDANGAFSVELVATNATGVVPNPFTYQVVERISGQRGAHRYTISLPKENPSVDIADVINITDFL